MLVLQPSSAQPAPVRSSPEAPGPRRPRRTFGQTMVRTNSSEEQRGRTFLAGVCKHNQVQEPFTGRHVTECRASERSWNEETKGTPMPMGSVCHMTPMSENKLGTCARQIGFHAGIMLMPIECGHSVGAASRNKTQGFFWKVRPA